MKTIPFYVERKMPCDCMALFDSPWQNCPEGGGGGLVYREIALTVEYSAHKASRGARDRYGAQLEPDEDAHCEIQSVGDERGREMDLTPSETDHAEWACCDDAEDRACDYGD